MHQAAHWPEGREDFRAGRVPISSRFLLLWQTLWPRRLMKKGIYMSRWIQGDRVHDARAKAQRQEELRLHILICKQEAEKTNKKWSLKPQSSLTDKSPPTRAHLLTGDQALKHTSLWGPVSFQSPLPPSLTLQCPLEHGSQYQLSLLHRLIQGLAKGQVYLELNVLPIALASEDVLRKWEWNFPALTLC